MTNVQAAVGVAQMERVAELIESRATVASWYDEELADLGEFGYRPTTRSGNGHVYWMYPIISRSNVALSLDELMTRLADDGVETRPVFTPLHFMPPYYQPGPRFPVAASLGARGLALPTHSRVIQGRHQLHRVPLTSSLASQPLASDGQVAANGGRASAGEGRLA